MIDILARLTDSASGGLKALAGNIDLVEERGSIAQKGLSSLGDMVGGGLKSLAGVGVSGISLVGGAMVDLGAKAIELGSDVEEMRGKFDVVFSETGPKVTQELNNFASAVGRNKFELQGFAAGLGDTLKPLGFTEGQAADLSVEVTKLAVDLASFNNMPMDEAVMRLNSALVGNVENLQAFGVVANQASIEAKALEMGIWDGEGAIDAYTKAQAIMQITMEGTTDAQGDALRTAGSFANRMRALKGSLAETTAQIGGALLPLVTPLITKFAEIANEIGPKVIEFFENIAPSLEILGDAFVTLIEGDVAGFIGGVGEAVLSLGQSLGFPTGLLLQLAVVFDTLRNAIENNLGFWDTFSLIMAQFIPQETIDKIIEIKDRIVEFAEPIIKAVTDFVEFKDVLIVLGGVLGVLVLNAIIGVVAALAPLLLVAGALIAGVALLRTAWEENWGGIREKTAAVITFLQELITTIFTGIQEFWAEHGEAIKTKAAEIWDAIKLGIETAINTISTVINTVVTGIQEFWAEHGEAIKTKAAEIWDAIKTTVDTLINEISTIITTAATGIQEFWAEHGEAITEAAEIIWEGIKEFISGIWDSLTTLFTAFKAAFEGDWETFGENIRLAWEEKIQATADFLGTLWDLMKPHLSAMWDNLKAWWDNIDWDQLGDDIKAGVLAGISGLVDDLIGELSAAASAAQDAWNGFWGNASPSKWMIASMGDVTDGAVIGFDGDRVVNKAAAVARSVGNVFTDTLNGGKLGGSILDGLQLATTRANGSQPASPTRRGTAALFPANSTAAVLGGSAGSGGGSGGIYIDELKIDIKIEAGALSAIDERKLVDKVDEAVDKAIDKSLKRVGRRVNINRRSQ